MVVNVDTKNVTLKVNSKIYDNYKDLCKQKGLIISRQFEILMEKQLEKEGVKKWGILKK